MRLTHRVLIQRRRDNRTIECNPVLLFQKQLKFEAKKTKPKLRWRTIQAWPGFTEVLAGKPVFASGQESLDAML
ncbi:hypothetical protein [Variovorax sp. E3]|uniref:hypothetical protein n=1 Tax=Variovorax sp. E3 TaxID=1914993 RepID=UPI0018DB5535|nr:hypothetical protein [Variovorax sp. E3]